MTNSIKYSRWVPLSFTALLAASFSLLSQSCDKAEPKKPTPEKTSKNEKEQAPTKVLYVTHEPGRYHDYTGQRKIFTQIAKENHWELSVISAKHDDLIKILAESPDFGKDADVIVYNLCMAHCEDPMVPYNIIQQTEKKGKPALLIHCALHSFWSTYKEKGDKAVHAPGAHKKAHTRAEILASWQKNHPDKKFPSWPTFTGFASTKHTPQGPVNCIRLKKEHVIFKGVSDYQTHKDAELYNNFIGPKDEKNVISLLKGKNPHGEAIMLWENKVAETKVISFTLGHSIGEWNDKPYRKILANTVNYLSE